MTILNIKPVEQLHRLVHYFGLKDEIGLTDFNMSLRYHI